MYTLGTNPTNYKTYTDRVRAIYQQPVAKTSSALVLTLLTITFFGFAAIRPTLSTVSSLVAELNQKREIEQKMINKLAIMDKIQTQFLSNEDKLLVFDQVIPRQHEIDQTFLIIEYLAFINDVSITTLSVSTLGLYPEEYTPPQKSQTKSTIPTIYQPIPLRLNVSAPISSLEPFIDSLSQLYRLHYIQSLNINSSDTKEEGVYSTTITLYTFYDPIDFIAPTLTDSQ